MSAKSPIISTLRSILQSLCMSKVLTPSAIDRKISLDTFLDTCVAAPVGNGYALLAGKCFSGIELAFFGMV